MSYLIVTLLSIYIIFKLKSLKLIIGKNLKVLDVPTINKIHTGIIPLTASYGLLIVSFALLTFLNLYLHINNLNTIIFCSYLFFFVGYLDDRYNLNPYLRLLISILVLIIFIIYGDNLVLNKLYSNTIDKHFVLKYPYNYFFTVLCILLLINSVNLIDGINGLASMFVGQWLLLLTIVSPAEISKILFIFSIVIFINTYYIYKNEYFLGDSGTLFFGCIVSLITIYNYNINYLENIIVPLEKIFIFFMIPGIDMFRLFVERIINRKHPFKRDLNHLHHILRRFFSLKTTLAVYFLLFMLTNLLTNFNLLKDVIIIFSYLTIYLIFIYYHKKLHFIFNKN